MKKQKVLTHTAMFSTQLILLHSKKASNTSLVRTDRPAENKQSSSVDMIMSGAGVEPSSLVEEAEELLRVRDQKQSLALPPLEVTDAERWTFVVLSHASPTHPHGSVHAYFSCGTIAYLLCCMTALTEKALASVL